MFFKLKKYCRWFFVLAPLNLQICRSLGLRSLGVAQPRRNIFDFQGASPRASASSATWRARWQLRRNWGISKGRTLGIGAWLPSGLWLGIPKNLADALDRNGPPKQQTRETSLSPARGSRRTTGAWSNHPRQPVSALPRLRHNLR